MLCNACNELKIGKRGVPPHKGLEKVGRPRRGKTPVGQAGIQLQDYVCRDCATLWTYEDDRNDNHTGWGLATAESEFTDEYQRAVESYKGAVHRRETAHMIASKLLPTAPEEAEHYFREAQILSDEVTRIYGLMVKLQSEGKVWS